MYQQKSTLIIIIKLDKKKSTKKQTTLQEKFQSRLKGSKNLLNQSQEKQDKSDSFSSVKTIIPSNPTTNNVIPSKEEIEEKLNLIPPTFKKENLGNISFEKRINYVLCR